MGIIGTVLLALSVLLSFVFAQLAFLGLIGSTQR